MTDETNSSSIASLASAMGVEGVVEGKQLRRFLLAKIDHQDGHLGVRRQFRAEMPVDQLQRSIVKLAGN